MCFFLEEKLHFLLFYFFFRTEEGILIVVGFIVGCVHFAQNLLGIRWKKAFRNLGIAFFECNSILKCLYVNKII